MDSITIEVPFLPPEEHSPNARVHWSQRYRSGKVYQDAVYYCAVDARNRAILLEPFPKASLMLTLIFPQKRRRDADNFLAAFKPGLDALKMAGLIVDDNTEHLIVIAINIWVDRARAPATIIQLRRV